ncbi:TetR family transcriptional regulator [Streptomyces sp. SID6673]|nr:TetR family transcriptional regulator [Streptomyces sp. SID11726]NEB23254.1 TetR family transcriptional regulator [Streptomyces sp. SID6673]
MTAEQRTVAGRPRDPEKDVAVLDAARALLREGGYQAANIAAIARRAGVGTPTVYRRWARRETLIEDAVFGARDISLPTPTDDLHADLRAWVRLFLAHLADPATRAAIPGLLAAYQQDEDLYGTLLTRVERSVRSHVADAVAEVIPSGSATLRAARTDALFDLLVGATLVRALTFGLHDSESFCTQTADALMALAMSEWDPQSSAVVRSRFST